MKRKRMKMYNISASSHYSENVEEKFKNKFSTFFPQKSYRLQDKIEGNMSRARKAVGIMQPHTHTHTHTVLTFTYVPYILLLSKFFNFIIYQLMYHWIVLKNFKFTLKLTLKQLQMFQSNHRHQGAHYSILLNWELL